MCPTDKNFTCLHCTFVPYDMKVCVLALDLICELALDFVPYDMKAFELAVDCCILTFGVMGGLW